MTAAIRENAPELAGERGVKITEKTDYAADFDDIFSEKQDKTHDVGLPAWDSLGKPSRNRRQKKSWNRRARK